MSRLIIILNGDCSFYTFIFENVACIKRTTCAGFHLSISLLILNRISFGKPHELLCLFDQIESRDKARNEAQPSSRRQ